MCNGLPAERLTSWGVARGRPTAAARAPEAARGLRRRRDAFQGWPVPRTLRAAAGGFPYHQVWPPPATFHLPPASRRRRRRPPAAAPSSARCGPPATRFAARTASHTHGASSCPSASLSGGVGRRTGHARDPLAGVNEPTVTPSGHEARWRCRRTGRPALCRARWNSTGRPPKVRQASDGRFASSLSTTS